MSATLSFVDRLKAVVIPTRAQALMAVILSLVIMLFSQIQAILERLDVDQTVIDGVKAQYDIHLSNILRTNVASQIAIVTFWAGIGLIAYLICWGVYNAIIEARNEVTLNTAYVNRGHWHGPWETLGLKTGMAVGLIASLAVLTPGIAFWVVKAGNFISLPGLETGLYFVLALVGIAVQLYAVLLFAQLTFMPWYRAETFTEV